MKGPARQSRSPSAPVVKLGWVSMRVKPWGVPDGLWERIEPLLPVRPRRFRYPGRKPFDDRLALQAILLVLHTGIGSEHLPQELGHPRSPPRFTCCLICWQRLQTSLS